jgi:hypothetical protein
MEMQTYSFKVDKEEIVKARKECSKNLTTLQMQIREFVRRVSNGEIILKDMATN